MSRVPVLSHPAIRQRAQCPSVRAYPICPQNRLPDRKDRDQRALVPFEDRFDCGRPPQTGRSRWRQQDNKANAVGALVEVVAERCERTRVECDEGRLSVGDVRKGLVPSEPADHGDDRQGPDEAAGPRSGGKRDRHGTSIMDDLIAIR
jgi:hypothetical protein